MARTGVISQVEEDRAGNVVGVILDQCGPNNPAINSHGDEGADVFLKSDVKTIVANSGGQKCHATIGANANKGLTLSTVLADVASKHSGDPATTVPGAVFEIIESGWQYDGNISLGGYSPTVKKVDLQPAPASSSASSGSGSNSGGGGPATESFTGVIYLKDGAGAYDIDTCYGNPPQHATKASQLSATTPSYQSGDTANGVNCLLNDGSMDPGNDALSQANAGVGTIVTGTVTNGNQIVTIH